MQGPAHTGSSPAYRESASKQAHADEQRAAGCCQPGPCASGCSALSSGSRGRCSGEPGCRNWNLTVADMNPCPQAWRHNRNGFAFYLDQGRPRTPRNKRLSKTPDLPDDSNVSTEELSLLFVFPAEISPRLPALLQRLPQAFVKS